MKRTLIYILLIIVMGMLACTSPKKPAASLLQTRGQEIVDDEGRRFSIRAVGLGNWLLPEGYMWNFEEGPDRPRTIEKMISDLIGETQAKEFWRRFRQFYITEADIARIKALGFNTVRPAINWRVLMDENSGELSKSGFQLLDNLVEWCKIHQVYVIFDMHGAPGGQTGSNIDDSRNNAPELFTDPIAQDRLVTLWTAIAKRYSRESIVLAYDLLNEPLPKEYQQLFPLLEPLYQRLVAAIRQVDPNHIITLEGAHWANDFSIFGKPFADNLLYQFHKYWTPPDSKSLEPYLSFRTQYNVPLWEGESGENTLDWYWAAFQLYEDHNIGWLFWPWKKMDTENTPYSIVKPQNWDALVKYGQGGEKPTSDQAAAILQELIENIKLENCVYFPTVVNAIFRRIPARIEAENFGHLGEGISFALVEPDKNAAVYRTSEPVPINEIEPESATRESHHQSAYAIQLKADEWTSYEINSTIDQVVKLIVKVKAQTANPNLLAEIDGQIHQLSRNYSLQSYFYNNSRPFTVTKGRHELKLHVDEGQVLIDWIEIN
ncbi:MAG: glycoside hydrolase family 5 protein [Calditrichaeota bacterium]|nr:MAG: glycoside hydrolase family 5 protein [Calditrichota bacterium]